jgi:hypothetical protein
MRQNEFMRFKWAFDRAHGQNRALYNLTFSSLILHVAACAGCLAYPQNWDLNLSNEQITQELDSASKDVQTMTSQLCAGIMVKKAS